MLAPRTCVKFLRHWVLERTETVCCSSEKRENKLGSDSGAQATYFHRTLGIPSFDLTRPWSTLILTPRLYPSFLLCHVPYLQAASAANGLDASSAISSTLCQAPAVLESHLSGSSTALLAALRAVGPVRQR